MFLKEGVLKSIKNLANKNKIKIVEDAAEAFVKTINI